MSLAALDAAGTLATLWDRGRVVPDVGSESTRELFVLRYRLMYEVRDKEIGVLAFVHGARDYASLRRKP